MNVRPKALVFTGLAVVWIVGSIWAEAFPMAERIAVWMLQLLWLILAVYFRKTERPRKVTFTYHDFGLDPPVIH